MATAELASVDGEISPTADARIPIADDGLLRGDGVFEVIRLYRGRPYAYREHLDRLERSAGAIELPVDRASLEREVTALLSELGESDGQLRIVLTRAGRRLAMTEPLPSWPRAVSVATVTYAPSVILTGVKSISYAANMQATRIAAAAGAEEAVLIRPDGTVLEAPTSSLFWVSPQGALRTPSLDSGILESITRAGIIRELEVDESEWPVEDFRAAQEAFLASTTREVHAISAIDGRELSHAPGPRTREATDAFAGILARELG
jgi:branched-chain amino acid aminotransferase